MPMLTRKELADKTNRTRQNIDMVISGRRLASRSLAKKLEIATGIGRLSWLYPDEFPNPYLAKTEKSGDTSAS